MKPRSALTATEHAELVQYLACKLDGVGIETQPEVAIKILDLVRQPDTGMADYAKVIRADAPLSGKLLRISNSAFFAQRDPVTSIDRACVLLGLERLRALALGFYLSKAAAGDPTQRISREVWTQSVYRACLSSEIARQVIPERVSEAFVIGLMLDAGIPLMHKLMGERYLEIWTAQLSPAPMFKREYSELPYTHADVMQALAKRWGLPELIAHPIAYHHTPPGDTKRTDAAVVLHKIAYYVGAVDLTPVKPEPREIPPLPSIAARLFEFSSSDVTRLIERATKEYHATSGLFSRVAGTIPDAEALSLRVHQQLVSIVEESVEKSLHPGGNKITPCSVEVGGSKLEVESDSRGYVTVYLVDGQGQRLISYRFRPQDETPETITHALGVELADDVDRTTLSSLLTALAA